VDRKGQYQKGRRKITQPVLRVDPEALADMQTEDPRFFEDVEAAVSAIDKKRVVFSRTTGWLLAFLFVGVLAGVVWVGSAVFTKQHQFDHIRETVRQTEKEVEELRVKNQEFERRLVEQETQVENLKEKNQ